MQQDKPDEASQGHHLINEDDIGSGDKTPGEKETEEQIRQIRPQPAPPAPPAKP